MNNYLYSIQPQHALNILNGLKTIELRKHAPKPPFVMWIYVTKAEPYINQDNPVLNGKYDKRIILGVRKKLNGLVVAKCVVETVTKLQYERWPNPNMETYMVPSYKKNGVLINDGNVSILEGAKLNLTELIAYGKGAPLYALHLTQLEILDKPLQVSEFYKDAVYIDTDNVGREITPTWLPIYPLTRAPQSYQKVIPPEVRK